MTLHKKTAASLAALVGLGALVIGGSAVTPATAQTAARLTAINPGGPMIPARERHPELRRALRTLERVETQLRKSARDFGGHREKAADLCHQAENEIQQALQYDKH